MHQPLDAVQRWMQFVITHPGGVTAGLQSESAQSQLAVAPDHIEKVVNRSRRLTSVERLAVYANAYYARLAECLEADFPIFRQTVGEETFADFVFAYLQSHPSHSYTLGQLGANFAKFLDETKPPPQPGDPLLGWADFLVDLARLERACSEVFDGPGVERGRGRESFSATRVENRERDLENDSRPPSVDGQSALTADDLRAIDPARWPDARLQLVPCLRLMECRFPVNAYYTAMKRGDATPEVPAASLSWLALTRRDFIVRRYDLTHPQFVLLSALQRGETVGQAILAGAEVVAHLGYKPTGCNTWASDQFAAELREWFATWAAAPMFQSVILHG